MKKKKEKKEVDFFREEYRLSFKFLKESKKYIYAMVSLFCLFVVIGFIVPLPEEITKQLLDYFRELIQRTEGFNSREMIWFLFTNNLTASFLVFVGGIFLGIIPLFNGILNGFVLGYAAKLSVLENGVFSLWRLFPHGIFELPALFISLGLGLRLGVGIFQEKTSFKSLFVNSLRVFLLIVVPLLIVAAIIEGSLIVFSG